MAAYCHIKASEWSVNRQIEQATKIYCRKKWDISTDNHFLSVSPPTAHYIHRSSCHKTNIKEINRQCLPKHNLDSSTRHRRHRPTVTPKAVLVRALLATNFSWCCHMAPRDEDTTAPTVDTLFCNSCFCLYYFFFSTSCSNNFVFFFFYWPYQKLVKLTLLAIICTLFFHT